MVLQIYGLYCGHLSWPRTWLMLWSFQMATIMAYALTNRGGYNSRKNVKSSPLLYYCRYPFHSYSGLAYAHIMLSDRNSPRRNVVGTRLPCNPSRAMRPSSVISHPHFIVTMRHASTNARQGHTRWSRLCTPIINPRLGWAKDCAWAAHTRWHDKTKHGVATPFIPILDWPEGPVQCWCVGACSCGVLAYPISVLITMCWPRGVV